MFTVTANTVPGHLRVIQDALRAYATQHMPSIYKSLRLSPQTKKIKWSVGGYPECIMELALYRPVT